MTAPILGSEPQYDRTRYGSAYDEIQVGQDRVFGAAFHEAFLDNPIPSINRMMELQSSEPRGIGGQYSIDPQSSIYRSHTPIDEEEFNRDYAQLGLKWDPNMSQENAAILASRKTRELRNRDIMTRGKGGFMETAGKFGSALAASLLDPVNIGLSFIPIVGEGRWAAWAAKYGATRTRLAVGAIEGAVGSAATEPLTFMARTEEQADYTAMDSLYNVIVGTVMGSGLHAVTGKIGDIYMRKIKGAQADLRATDTAAKQLADGKQVDVTAVSSANRVELIQADTRVNPDADARTTLNVREMRAGLIPRHEVVRTGKSTEVVFPDEAGKFKGMRGRGKTEDEAVRDLLSAYDTAFRYQEEMAVTADKFSALESEMADLVQQRNRLRATQNDEGLFRKKLVERGVPMDLLDELKGKIASRDAERANISGTKINKKLRLFDEETARMQAEYKELSRVNLADHPQRIREEMRNEVAAIETRMNALSKEIDTLTTLRAQDTLRKQELAQTSLEYEPDDLPDPALVRDREAEGLLESTEKDLMETEAEIKELTQGLEVTDADKEALKGLDEIIKIAEAKAKNLAQAVNCLLGKI